MISADMIQAFLSFCIVIIEVINLIVTIFNRKK